MRMPDEADLAFLFEGDREGLNRFIEKHTKRLKQGELNDIRSMAEEYTIEEQIPIVFAFVFAATVDWREYDEDIVHLFGKRLPDEQVEVETIEEGLLVTYNGTPHTVKLTFSGKDRYITIRAFNEMVKPSYEFRLFEGSYLSDTHDFLGLRTDTWEALEQRYPAKVAELFRVVDAELDFP
ncbi:hypothetical protein FE783_36710 [Paenibacillus mesophilus]|uniref:hypothetical protein n=1 Tax=Paenibacillus mesophilus TaxID=2582849 RepID=UPI00110EBFF8|nr:hypothetical protein [Paenibacillus mesophilus]TMV42952.1 hypothetical protein FE783_36710 [Paenibacillus mesophilus]